jgi:hypothetical protein
MLFWNTSYKLIRHKHFEIECQFNKDFWHWFNFHVSLSRKIDHAGFELRIEIIGLWIQISLYDNRHWDYDRNCWE